MKRKILLGLMFASSLLAKTELSLNIGINSFDNSEHLDSGTSLGIRGDFYLDDLYHIDLGYDNMSDVSIKNSSQDIKVERLYTQFSADGQEEYHVVPTVSIGVGGEKQTSSADSDTQGFLSLGVGFRYNVSNSFNFLLGTKALWKTTDRVINYHTTFGMGYLIDEAPVNNENDDIEEVVIPKKKLDIPEKRVDISTQFAPKKLPPVQVQVPDAKELSVVSVPASVPAPVSVSPIHTVHTVSHAASVRTSRHVVDMRAKYIQVGAYAKSRPTAMLSRLAKSGYHIILRHQGRVTKALVGPFKSEAEARRALAKVRRISPTAFIYKGY